MTDEQFKTWAVDFFDRIEMIHSWREAATEAIKMIEGERAKSAKLVKALEAYADPRAWIQYGTWALEDGGEIAREALANFRNKGAV